ncbi:MAG TPA: homoserine kinase [Limnobacter sp.]|uniref:homoserine kinase n=1 Tax=Limnobacter sp. TaxID=2003368 RepID=UPI002E34C728|nr:homoserine kinase [Limnobacter sp.]HEX5487139.1 homoserine kinase [Limnobacter sp.]
MAVFTRVTHDEIQHWLDDLACGELQSFEGIASGIENTNYFVNTCKGRYVLTIFEKLTDRELPFYLGLMQHLAGKGLPVPGPIASRDGALFRPLQGKPATLVNCLAGSSVTHPTPLQCEEIGRFSAKAHLAAADFAGTLENPRNLSWIVSAARAIKPHLPAEELSLLEDEILFQTQLSRSADYQSLEKGAVHADLFKDNALMQGEHLGGVIDFYFAGVDTYLFDLAVTANDWCIDVNTGEFLEPQLRALVHGYSEHRPFPDAEKRLWQGMLRAAALRFWTSRLSDYFMPREAEVLNVKDPRHFERVLKARRHSIPFEL